MSGLKGNPVKIRGSSRCCMFLDPDKLSGLFQHWCHSSEKKGKALKQNKPEDLPVQNLLNPLSTFKVSGRKL
jgi:hypothetical protein